MKANGEWERNDLVIDPDIWISDDGTELEVYIESWFDVDAKFGTKTRSDDDNWVNLYAFYNPKTNYLRMSFILAADYSEHSYKPTKAERDLITQLIKEKVEEISGVSPEEYLNLAA